MIWKVRDNEPTRMLINYAKPLRQKTVICLTFMYMLPAIQAQIKPDNALKLVQLEDIKVSGTHLPAASVIRLSGLKVGDKVNDLIVNAACHKITSTGLVKSIDYFYDLYPDKAGVSLTLALKDEGELLPASIRPSAEDDLLWKALVARDPIFQRQMPRTEKAMSFYATNLAKVLEEQGRKDEYAEGVILNDGTGQPASVVFEIRKYKTLVVPKEKPNER